MCTQTAAISDNSKCSYSYITTHGAIPYPMVTLLNLNVQYLERVIAVTLMDREIKILLKGSTIIYNKGLEEELRSILTVHTIL